MPAWAIVLIVLEGAAVVALAVATWTLWHVCTGALYEAARRLDDKEALLRAILDDARALDERATDLEDQVQAIRENPLGPPADADSEEDIDGD